MLILPNFGNLPSLFPTHSGSCRLLGGGTYLPPPPFKRIENFSHLLTHLITPIMIDSTEIKRPKLYRLSYLHEGMGCIVRKYSMSKLLLKEFLAQEQAQNEKENGACIPIAKFWILQEAISNTNKEFWSDIWTTIEITPEIDFLFEPEKKTELERNYNYRREL